MMKKMLLTSYCPLFLSSDCVCTCNWCNCARCGAYDNIGTAQRNLYNNIWNVWYDILVTRNIFCTVWSDRVRATANTTHKLPINAAVMIQMYTIPINNITDIRVVRSLRCSHKYSFILMHKVDEEPFRFIALFD